jgi:hypothetical protein
MWTSSVALRRPTDRRQQRGIVIIAELGNGTRIDRDGALTVINVVIDRGMAFDKPKGGRRPITSLSQQ